jgi:hypothetical protein
MPKGQRITEAVEILIASVYTEHPKWTAMKIQHRVSALLRERDPGLPPDWPGLNSVQKTLALLRKRSREEDPLGKPWSLGVSAQHGIAPDAIPVILKVWELWEQSELSTRRRRPASRPSIREAQWVSRLRHVIHDDIEALGKAASVYAKVEGLSEWLGHPVFDSTGLDHGLIRSRSPLPFDLGAAVEHVRLGSARPQDGRHLEEPSEDEPAGRYGGLE